jgi:hypothetical protein
MSNAERLGAEEPDPRILHPATTAEQVADAPAPVDGTVQEQASPQGDPRQLRLDAQRQAISIPVKRAPRAGNPSGFGRALGALRVVLPLVQKILPLLEGNIPLAVANILAPSLQGPPPNLAPLEHALDKLTIEHRELRSQIASQSAGLKQLEDQLQVVKEAAERNRQEQQELMQDLRSFRKKVYTLAWIALSLLAALILADAVLFLRIQRFTH